MKKEVVKLPRGRYRIIAISKEDFADERIRKESLNQIVNTKAGYANNNRSTPRGYTSAQVYFENKNITPFFFFAVKLKKVRAKRK